MMILYWTELGNKGTGKWTSQVHLDLGVPLPCYRICFSLATFSFEEERCTASEILPKPTDYSFDGDTAVLVKNIRKALYSSKIWGYAQGFAQMRTAYEEYDWNLQYGQIAKFFRAGCIIRLVSYKKLQMRMKKILELKNLC